LVSQQFGFYHVGIFLLDDKQEYAVLAAANSTGGQQMIQKGHKLKIGQVGIVGYTAARGNARIALDTGLDATYFDNPDLPDTRSELALPLKLGTHVIGVLDVQSLDSSAFTNDDIASLTILADQVSIAIENTRQYEATLKSLEQTEATYRQYVQHEWTRLAQEENLTGYRYISGSSSRLETPVDFGDIKAIVNAGRIYQGDEEKTGAADLAVPVKLRGEVIGILSISTAGKNRWSDDEIDIVEAVAERLALSIENARLFQVTTNRAERERVVSEIASKISGNLRMDSLLRTTAQELSLAMNGSEVLIQLQAAKQDRGPQ
jgi:GAF domain-containing protein